jgi:hypothetical protein
VSIGVDAGTPEGPSGSGQAGAVGPSDSSAPSGPSGSSGPLWCGRCGREALTGEHSACLRALELEPPRYCTHCRRRMVVQVLPRGWSARCVEHGTLASPA